MLPPVIAGNGELKITGKLRYQACDDKICYLPETVPLEWTLKVEPLDRERAPRTDSAQACCYGSKVINLSVRFSLHQPK